MTDPGLDQPEPDVVEQSQDAITGDPDRPQAGLPEQVPIEADEADVAEQAREVDADDEDYR